ncbi:MAG: class I SAM-dependent methyltransferase [Xanthobacteraceae bacterium]|nr:class I SAM-dependent methyltransferase [Xanthobacteraceae bacterium]
MPVHLELGGTIIDHIEFEPYGTIRVCGWSVRERLPDVSVTTIEGRLAAAATYRYAREDVCAALGIEKPFAGLAIEFRTYGAKVRSVEVEGRSLAVPNDIGRLLNGEQVGYVELLDGERVLHRSDIYGEGPPTNTVHPEVLELARLLEPPILDFGCGSGALLRALRASGGEVFGIEIARPAISQSIHADVAPFITLYDGTFPLPYKDGQFESVIATEVIEHVADYRTALAEIARVCRTTFAITVPDMSCIPIGSIRGFVPWHLLEGTHVNFFNHRSLRCVLAPHFPAIRFFQIARGALEGRFIPGSLGAIATK